MMFSFDALMRVRSAPGLPGGLVSAAVRRHRRALGAGDPVGRREATVGVVAGRHRG